MFMLIFVFHKQEVLNSLKIWRKDEDEIPVFCEILCQCTQNYNRNTMTQTKVLIQFWEMNRIRFCSQIIVHKNKNFVLKEWQPRLTWMVRSIHLMFFNFVQSASFWIGKKNIICFIYYNRSDETNIVQNISSLDIYPKAQSD